jgi:hypothetical protein
MATMELDNRRTQELTGRTLYVTPEGAESREHEIHEIYSNYCNGNLDEFIILTKLGTYYHISSSEMQNLETMGVGQIVKLIRHHQGDYVSRIKLTLAQ